MALEPAMEDKALKALQDRTDAKLRYAGAHLDELKAMPIRRGDDFDRAHQESFLYHLLGVRDAFLAELNAYYVAGLSGADITLGNLKKALARMNRPSLEIGELYTLERDPEGWLNQARGMRDHSTHVAAVPRIFHVGGEDDGTVWLQNPKTNEILEQDFILAFQAWLATMSDLIQRLRLSALQNTRRI
jgi:hypothetical protein